MKDQVRTPLRTVLRNFLNHIEKLESSINPEKSYEAEFQVLFIQVLIFDYKLARFSGTT